MNTIPAPEAAPARRLGSVSDFIASYSGPGSKWCLVRLSGTDTTATAARLAGPTLPRDLLVELFPGVEAGGGANGVFVDAVLPREGYTSRVQVVVYTKIYFQKVREESRLSGWGREGASVVGAESTGALAAFAFHRSDSARPYQLAVWICRDAEEEHTLEEWSGPVQSGVPVVLAPADKRRASTLPSPDALASKVLASTQRAEGADSRLIALHSAALRETAGIRSGSVDARQWSDQLVACLLSAVLTESGISAHPVSGVGIFDSAVGTRNGTGDTFSIGVRSAVRYTVPAGRVLTLQQGISEARFAAIAGQTDLIVPAANIRERLPTVIGS